jgi:hypothetical protein
LRKGHYPRCVNEAYQPTKQGAGEVGKSTLWKQLKLAHNGMDEIELTHFYKPSIVENVLDALQVTLRHMKRQGIPIPDDIPDDIPTILYEDIVYDEKLIPYFPKLLQTFEKLENYCEDIIDILNP